MASLREDKKRLEDAVKNAEEAFWNSIAEDYPEITTGDLDPSTSIDLMLTMENAIDRWLIINNPKS